MAVGYEVHQTRGETKTARRAIELDDTTSGVLAGWLAYQAADFAAVGIDGGDDWVFTDGDGEEEPGGRRWNVAGTAGGRRPDPEERSENCESPGR